ncbi:MAG: hypothetical protein ACTSV3_03335 [Candidatus Thorarchaeota archaeon]|nr:MAG: hypothetical protein DRO87_02550 [Candidatus Thorarchaeota archaeon]
MTPNATWKIVNDDDSVEEFIDIRRKVGNQIIRAYLLDRVISDRRIEKRQGKLRGPKDEFKDIDKFLILRVQDGESTYRILAEAGVYENLRIVATDSQSLADEDPSVITKKFTDALQEPDPHNTTLIVSHGSKIG